MAQGAASNIPLVEKVLVIGGGIAGMSAAISLGRRGVDVEIAEIDPNWRVYGAGISITGPTLRAFNTLGVLEDIKTRGFCSGGARIFSQAGQLMFEDSPPAAGSIPGSGGIMRPVLHAILQEHSRRAGAVVRLGVTAERLEPSRDGVDVTFTDGGRGRYDLVIGADGLFSKTRETMFPEAPKPLFTGQGCWRVTAARPAEVDRAEIYLGGDSKAGLNPVSQDQMYMFLLEHVPDNPRIGPEELFPRLKALLAPYGGHMTAVREGLRPDDVINYRPLECVFVPPPWHRGRVVLMGDALHGATPHMASGAGMSVEDAIVLAEELGRGETLEGALNAYAARRVARCRLVVESSVKLGEIEMAQGDPAEHQRISRMAAEALREEI